MRLHGQDAVAVTLYSVYADSLGERYTGPLLAYSTWDHTTGNEHIDWWEKIFFRKKENRLKKNLTESVWGENAMFVLGWKGN